MLRLIVSIVFGFAISSPANAQTTFLSISSDDYQVTNVFSNVSTFAIDIEINAPLASGTFANPEIVTVRYSVSGTLASGTPSGFQSFALQRDITGTEFYSQGSSLGFEISPNAVLSDGVQAAELVGNGIVFSFNGREVDNGRFHPALFELNANGTGRIQNSDNVIVENPLQQVNFGDEYITDLMFDPGNTTLLTDTPNTPPPSPSGGSGASSPFSLYLLIILALIASRTQVHGRLIKHGQNND